MIDDNGFSLSVHEPKLKVQIFTSHLSKSTDGKWLSITYVGGYEGM